MIKLNLLLALIPILTLNTQAHDYKTIHDHGIALFENPSGLITGLRIDSLITETDTILYPFTSIQEISDGCFSLYNASWIGGKVVVKANGTSLFFNRKGDTITIETQAALNESWIVFQCADTFRVEASVQSVELENILGLNDSVKTIGFKVIDQQGEKIQHALNSQKLKISKNYGFVETLNFYLFPDIIVRYPTEQLEKYSLVGLTTPEVGIKNLSWFDVYDFNAGDELHIREHNFEENNSSSVKEYDNKSIFKYLERTNYPDSIVYRCARKQSIKTVFSDSSVFVIYDDTVKSVILANPDFDKLPGESVIFDGSAYFYSMRNNEFSTKIEPDANHKFVNQGDCWYALAWEGCLYEKLYIDGLGGPYYYCSGFAGDSKERKLVYYKKKDTEWGDPLIITSASNVNLENKLQVFPNPAHETVTFHIDNKVRTYKIQLFNQTGNLIRHEQFSGHACCMQLNGITQGIYIYRIIFSDSLISTGKLIIN